MKLINRAMAILCILAILSVGLVASVMAEKEPVATPTDLGPLVIEYPVTAEEPAPEETEPEAVSEPVIEEDPAEDFPEEVLSEEEPAAETPSEEVPAAETAEEEQAQEEDKPGVEIVIAKTLQPGQSWNGTIKRKTPTILKLDVDYSRKVFILVEGEDVLASVQKADRYDETVSGTLTDAATKYLVIELNAEAGSYLLSLHAGENSLLAKAAVSVMDQAAYDAWIAEQQEIEEEQPEETAEEPEAVTEDEAEPETDPEQPAEAETEAEDEPETEQESEQVPDETTEEETEETSEEETEDVTEVERNIEVNVTWDVAEPVIGDTAHFHAALSGYEGLEYSMQWQYSLDRKEWTDIAGETNSDMDVVVTEENNLYYWRIVVYLEDEEG